MVFTRASDKKCHGILLAERVYAVKSNKKQKIKSLYPHTQLLPS